MNQTFDLFNYPELPYIILCNPNRDELYSLSSAIYNAQLTIRFNALSEFEFEFPESIDGGETILEAFQYIQNKRLILVEGFGYFQIIDSTVNSDGAVPIKNVKCQSQESELIQKRVTVYSGTKKLWDALNSTGTVLQDMINLAPNYSVGYISPSLLTLYRTFDVSDTNVYEFLTNDVSQSFGCIVLFESTTRTINVYTVDDVTTETDIFLSYDNVISESEFSEKSDEIVTSLSVYGDGNLSINLVNPLGGTRIYDFSYYKNENWMSSSLVSALTAWESLVSSQQSVYSAKLLLLQAYNAEMITLRSELATLNEEYLSLEGIQKLRIQAGQPYADINAQLEAKQAEIDAQNVLIENKQTQITNTTNELQNIVSLLSFENNFTEPQLLELNNFIFENTWQNETIITTDSMTDVEVQQQAQELYNQGVDVLSKVSQPRYEFSLDTINFVSLSEFQIFTQQLELGCVVNAELENGSIIETVLLELTMQFDDPSNFKMVFSNRLRLDNGGFTYTDLMGQVVKTGSSVSFDSSRWSNWENNYKNDVTTFITSALDTTVNNLISNSNQEILINQNGLRARQSDGSGGYQNKQAWLVNNVLAFSDDGFQTAKLALGEINLPEGGTAYGLVADVIVGRLLAGNSLTIENEGNNFVLDSTGATLTNAKFSIQTTNTKILLDPTATNSFVIQKNEGGTFVNKFTVTNSGDVVFSGTLSGASGTFSGSITATVGNIGTLVIDSQGLKTSDNQNYLRGDGSLKWGGLTISGSSASFNGTIFANKLSGQVVDSQVASGLGADKVTYGSMSGTRIFGGTPTVNSIAGTAAGSFVSFAGGIGTSFVSAPGSTSTFGSLSIGGNITVSGGTGINQIFSITTPSGTRFLSFSRGILVSYTS